MVTKFIEVEDFKLAYDERNENATNTIFFIPGNSVSKSCWRKQYKSDELSANRMIAFDLPAHGDSDALDTKNYTLPRMAEIIFKCISRLIDGKPFIIAGVSLGTNIIAEMLALDIHPKGLVLAGPCVFGKDYNVAQFAKPNTHVGVVFDDNPKEEDVLEYANETSASSKDEDLKLFLEDFKKVKIPFRSTLGKSIVEENFNDEIKLMQKRNIPLLVIFGKDERVIDCNYLDNAELPLWNKTLYKIEGASHLVNIDQSLKFNKLFKEFATDIFK